MRLGHSLVFPKTILKVKPIPSMPAAAKKKELKPEDIANAVVEKIGRGGECHMSFACRKLVWLRGYEASAF